jgi:hypothetical protein
LGVFVAFVVAGCSSEESPDPVAPTDAGVVTTRPSARDATVGPTGPTNPTARCVDPKPAPGVFVPPDLDVADGGDPTDAADDGGLADAGAPVDAGDDGGIVSTAIRPLRVPSSGGPVLAMPRWVPVFFQDTDDREDIEDFLGSIGCTDYWRAIASDYGVGEGISAPAITVAEDGPSRSTDDQIQKWLAKQIRDKTVEAPTDDTVYVIFYPTSSVITLDSDRSCFGFGGYHNDLALGSGKYAAYAVIPHCGNFEEVTSTTTHELIEAATDPYPEHLPAYSGPDEADQVWRFVAGGEVGDLCTFIDDSTFTPDGYPYRVQRSFSNKASVEGHDPCVPSSEPYFYAAPSLESSVNCADCGNVLVNAIYVPAGGSKVVDVTLGADGPVGTLQVEVRSGDHLPLIVPAGSGSSYALDKAFGEPGEHLRLTITSASTASESELFALVASRFGTRHSWYGMIVH